LGEKVTRIKEEPRRKQCTAWQQAGMKTTQQYIDTFSSEGLKTIIREGMVSGGGIRGAYRNFFSRFVPHCLYLANPLCFLS